MATETTPAPIRIEGRSKVTGAALYTGDFSQHTLQPYLHPGEPSQPLLYAAAVQSELACGTILAIDTSAAEAIPGLHSILTHQNAPRLKPIDTMMQSELSKLLPLQSPQIHYHGQPVALVLAATSEAAHQAASLIQITCEPAPSILDFDNNLAAARPEKKVGSRGKGQQQRGNPDKALASAPIQLDHTYITEAAHHNALEPGATIAYWHNAASITSDTPTELTVLCSTQFVYGEAIALGIAFDLGRKDSMLRFATQWAFGHELTSKVRVIAPFVGGGFGSKGNNSHLLLAAMAAKAAQQPVKLVLTRPQSFSMMPYRAAAIQRIAFGADTSGKLTAMLHHSILQNSTTASFVEPTGEMTPHLYNVPNLSIRHDSVRLHLNSPGWMRAPGVAPAQFAIESAMDELADQLHIDPIELRLRNYAEHDPDTGHPWSSKHLRECYTAGAHAIGWHNRPTLPGTLIQSGEQIGYGMATAIYPTNQFPATVRITLTPSTTAPHVTALIQTSAHEIGQGAITALSQVAAEALHLPLHSIRLHIGDTALPMSMMAGGSSTTLSVGSAIHAAAARLLTRLTTIAITAKASPLYNCKREDLRIRNGILDYRLDSTRAESISNLLTRTGRASLEAKGVTGRTFGRSSYGRAAFGAQFIRVAIHPRTRRIRVTNAAGAFACGRILNARTARSQFMGGVVWGIGHALMERTTLDLSHGAWLNDNLGEALVPTNRDIPEIDIIMIDEDDSRGSHLGVKGIGEIGITGVAGAIANAVYNATGKRIRTLPITADRLR